MNLLLVALLMLDLVGLIRLILVTSRLVLLHLVFVLSPVLLYCGFICCIVLCFSLVSYFLNLVLCLCCIMLWRESRLFVGLYLLSCVVLCCLFFALLSLSCLWYRFVCVLSLFWSRVVLFLGSFNIYCISTCVLFIYHLSTFVSLFVLSYPSLACTALTCL